MLQAIVTVNHEKDLASVLQVTRHYKYICENNINIIFEEVHMSSVYRVIISES